MNLLYESGGYTSNGELKVYDTREGLNLIMGWKAESLIIPKEMFKISNGGISLLDKTGEEILQKSTMQLLAKTLGEIVEIFSINEDPWINTINGKVLSILDDLGYQSIDDEKGQNLKEREAFIGQWNDFERNWVESN